MGRRQGERSGRGRKRRKGQGVRTGRGGEKGRRRRSEAGATGVGKKSE
jgi:hypothetical protein